jgi:hypothetical protein
MASQSLQPTCPGKCFIAINRLMNQPSGSTARREEAILAVATRYCDCQRTLHLCDPAK